MKFFLFALFLLPGLAQATPLTFGFSATSDQMTNQSPPALSDIGGPVEVVNLRAYDGQPLNSKELSPSLGNGFSITGQLTTTIPDPLIWLMLGAGFIGLALLMRTKK